MFVDAIAINKKKRGRVYDFQNIMIRFSKLNKMSSDLGLNYCIQFWMFLHRMDS